MKNLKLYITNPNKFTLHIVVQNAMFKLSKMISSRYRIVLNIAGTLISSSNFDPIWNINEKLGQCCCVHRGVGAGGGSLCLSCQPLIFFWAAVRHFYIFFITKKNIFTVNYVAFFSTIIK